MPMRRCRCVVNVTLFSGVTLIRKLQSKSDLDHFHARDLPCSCVKSRDDPISDSRVVAQFPIPLYRVQHKKITTTFLGSCLSNGKEFQDEILHAYLLTMYLHAGINSI